MPLEFVSVPTADVRAWARYVADYVKRLSEREHITPERQIDEAASARKQWHFVIEGRCSVLALVTTELWDCANGRRECRVGVAGRDMRAWLPLVVSSVEEWAKQANATHVRYVGRVGWERALKPLGAKRVGVILEKELV